MVDIINNQGNAIKTTMRYHFTRGRMKNYNNDNVEEIGALVNVKWTTVVPPKGNTLYTNVYVRTSQNNQRVGATQIPINCNG